VCGGKGAQSRKTPTELTMIGERTGFDAPSLVRASRLIAKVDSAAVQDGFELYLHGFIASADGQWCVVQQGMNGGRREARRYHWLSENLQSFLDSPHAAIEGRNQGAILNLADARAERNRRAGIDLVREGPDRPVAVLRRMRESASAALSLFPETEPLSAPTVPHLQMPAHHDVRAADVDLRRLHAVLAAAAENGPRDFVDLLLTSGVGARTVAAIALVAEVLHGAPARFNDPARFSMAHGGKDGHPFPVPLTVYDETIGVLKRAVAQAKLGNDERLAAIRRLDQQARLVESVVTGPAFDEFVANERARAPAHAGRTVFDGK
jgi:uncharacterized protein